MQINSSISFVMLLLVNVSWFMKVQISVLENKKKILSNKIIFAVNTFLLFNNSHYYKFLVILEKLDTHIKRLLRSCCSGYWLIKNIYTIWSFHNKYPVALWNASHFWIKKGCKLFHVEFNWRNYLSGIIISLCEIYKTNRTHTQLMYKSHQLL